jgi:AcrR family transcriptional regulator
MSTQQRRTRERNERHRRIIATARQLAEADGWDSVTTRRLADAIEYSQPVLYSHFPGKNAIIQAAAVEGFAELAAALRAARQDAAAPQAALLELARAYLAFAQVNPALYEAMFTLADLPFGQRATPAPVSEAFAELRQALAPFTGNHDLDTLGEITWSTLHGLATLTRSRRLRPGHDEERLTMLIRQLTSADNCIPSRPSEAARPPTS